MGSESWNAVIRKSMITAVHPVEDRYLNVREMMHLMGLPHDFQVSFFMDEQYKAGTNPIISRLMTGRI